MRLCFGDAVVSQDGARLGVVSSVQVDRANSRVLGVVVGQSDRLPKPTFVPVDMIQGETRHGLMLLANADTIVQLANTQLDPWLQNEMIPGEAPGSSAEVPPGTPETGGLPTVARNQVTITGRTAVRCIDGECGNLACVLTDQYTIAITSLGVSQAAGGKEATVPSEWIENLGDRTVTLSCTKEQLSHLPEPTPGFYMPVEQEEPGEQAQG